LAKVSEGKTPAEPAKKMNSTIGFTKYFMVLPDHPSVWC
jgi:hypothetical protein